jgi:hypothetical protein
MNNWMYIVYQPRSRISIIRGDEVSVFALVMLKVSRNVIVTHILTFHKRVVRTKSDIYVFITCYFLLHFNYLKSGLLLKSF